MTIEINNLGPINHFKFDLDKDLNLVFGENNIGKSYAITAIYLIIKSLSKQGSDRQIIPIEFLLYSRRMNLSAVLDTNDTFRILYDEVTNLEANAIEKIKKSESDEIDYTEQCELIIKNIIQAFYADSVKQSFENSFESLSSLQSKYSDDPVSIKLLYQDFSFSFVLNEGVFIVENVKLKKPIIIRKVRTNRSAVFSEDKITIYFNQRRKKEEVDIMRGLVPLVQSLTYEITNKVNKLYFLPASRSGLYQALSTFSAVIAELSKSRTFLQNKIELPNISEPVSDYFLYLSNIQGKIVGERYLDIINKIEDKILGGKVVFNEDSKRIVFQPNELDLELDVTFTSSMIAEIAPIVAFLKYIIDDQPPRSRIFIESTTATNRKKHTTNLLFIEEPEAHLHPKIQVQLMELFGFLTRNGVKIVMTTHSNYMFNKLSNLILDKSIDYTKVGSYLLEYKEGIGSLINFEAMKATEEGIMDSNFADVAEELYDERINIYEKLNESKDAG